MMQAGTYYIGDLCYVMHDVWDEVCMFDEGELTLKDGRKIAIYSTAYGDGEYDGCWVDSGTIGCIRIEDIKDEEPSVNVFSNERTKGWKMIEFKTDFSTSKEGGSIIFGNVLIYTGDESESEYE